MVPRLVTVAIAVLAVTATACSGAGRPAPPAARYFVSVGDSYASGYQPDANDGRGGNTTNGFA